MPQRGRAATPRFLLVVTPAKRDWPLVKIINGRSFAQAILFSWCRGHTQETAIDLFVEPRPKQPSRYDNRSYFSPMGAFRRTGRVRSAERFYGSGEVGNGL